MNLTASVIHEVLKGPVISNPKGIDETRLAQNDIVHADKLVAISSVGGEARPVQPLTTNTLQHPGIRYRYNYQILSFFPNRIAFVLKRYQ